MSGSASVNGGSGEHELFRRYLKTASDSRFDAALRQYIQHPDVVEESVFFEPHLSGRLLSSLIRAITYYKRRERALLSTKPVDDSALRRTRSSRQATHLQYRAARARLNAERLTVDSQTNELGTVRARAGKARSAASARVLAPRA